MTTISFPPSNPLAMSELILQHYPIVRILWFTTVDGEYSAVVVWLN